MSHHIKILPQAREEFAHYKNSGKVASYNKIKKIILELREHPATGTVQPEKLKYNLSGYWSRRIDKKNRLIYRIEEDNVIVLVV
ncbi:MAG TPA: Txe/YoeB family addiction module toxin [Mariniphaga anaerophila]|uniref:Putative mRNA interferase YoeB n=1 Tax=Mariniphaga anaerophila TaxID=1484053 RepID=A0A831LJN9_9BACT|nr:Txe/YoeB family addiction module toxin [Mariniphaga anaerophila]